MFGVILTALREALTKDLKTLLHVEACVAELAELPQYQLDSALAGAGASSKRKGDGDISTSLLSSQYMPSGAIPTRQTETDPSGIEAGILDNDSASPQAAPAPRRRAPDLPASTASISSGEGDGELEGDTAGGLDERAEAEWALFETRKDHMREALLWAKHVAYRLCRLRRRHDVDFELEMDMAESDNKYTFQSEGKSAVYCALAQAESKRALREYMAGRRAEAINATRLHKYEEIGERDDDGKDEGGHGDVRVLDGASMAHHSQKHKHEGEKQSRVLGWLAPDLRDAGEDGSTYKLGPARLLSFPRTHGRLLVLYIALWGRERWDADFAAEDVMDEAKVNEKKAQLEEELRRKFAGSNGDFIDVLKELTLTDFSTKYIEPLCALLLEGRIDTVSFLWHYPGAIVPYDPMRLMLSMTDLLLFKEFYQACEEHEWNSYTAVLVDPDAYFVRACLTFGFQAVLYIGALFSQEARVSDGGWFTHATCIIILLFTYQFSILSALSEYYSHTSFFFLKRKTIMDRMALIFHFLDNCLFVLLLPVVTARLLRTSSTFIDIAINSVVLYFIADIDKMGVSAFDQRYLNSRLAKSAIRVIRETGASSDPCALANRFARSHAAKAHEKPGSTRSSISARYHVPTEAHLAMDGIIGVGLIVLSLVCGAWSILEFWELL